MNAWGISADIAALAKRRYRRFAGDRSGAAAIEFALVVPLLVGLYFVTAEVGQAIDTNKKVARAASTVADLVTQQLQTSDSQLASIMTIGDAILQPYSRSDPTIVVTAIQVSDTETPRAEVLWSKALIGSTCASADKPGTQASVPENIKIRGSFLIQVKTCLGYLPMLTWAAGTTDQAGLGVLDRIFSSVDGSLAMSETYYSASRHGQQISCPSCSPN